MMYRWMRIFLLSRTISRINFGFLNFRHKLRERPDMYSAVLTFFGLSIAAVIWYYYFQMLGQLYTGLSELGLEDLFCRAGLSAVSVILSVVSAFLLINLFCFSEDSEYLQVFPVKPCDILTGRYLTVILFCCGIEIFLLFPMCIVQMQATGKVSAAVTYISAAAILPHIVVFPMAVLVTVCLKISMLLKRMRAVPAVFGITAYFAGKVVQTTAFGRLPGTGQELFGRFQDLIEPFPFYSQYICLPPGRKLLCGMLAALSVGGYCCLSNFVIGKQYAVYDRKAWIRSKVMRYGASSRLKSYFRKECRIFFRSPVYVINGLFGIIAAPFLLPLSFRISTDAESMEQIRTLISSPEFSFYATLLALAAASLTSAVSGVASSSFSREGAGFWITKTIPYPMRSQAFVKALFSTGISAAGIFLNCLIFRFYFHYSLIQTAAVAFVGTLAAVLWNVIGVLIDMKRPRLDWTSEAEAVRQNVNVILSVLICIAVAAGYIAVVTKMLRSGAAAWAVMSFLICSLSVLILLVCKGIASHRE